MDTIWRYLSKVDLNLGDIFGPNSPWKVAPLPPETGTDIITIYLRNILIIIVVGLIIIWVVFSLISGIKYMMASGNDEKQKEAALSFKNLFLGVGLAILVVIVITVITSLIAAP